MLDELINSLSEEKGAELASLGIPAEKTGDALNLAKTGLMDQFKIGAENDNLGDMLNLFNGKQDIASSPMGQIMIGSYAAQLASKIGVSPQVAQRAATMLLPSLLAKLNEDTPADGLTQDNLTELMGGAGGIAGLMDKVKGMFG
jgi:hypothetical protein